MARSQFSMLLKLPKYLLLRFIAEWLHKTRLSRLDLAVCSKEHREKFLTDVATCPAILSSRGGTRSMAYWRWVKDRNIKISRLGVSHTIPVVTYKSIWFSASSMFDYLFSLGKMDTTSDNLPFDRIW